MGDLTSRERIQRILQRQPVDRIGVNESFWYETLGRWRGEGHMAEDVSPEEHFDFDFLNAGWWNLVADLDAEDEVLEETDETWLVRDGNGAVMRTWKHKAGTPDHVDFAVKDRAAWEELIRPRLTNDADYARRIYMDSFREVRDEAARREKFFYWCGVNVFECMHPVCGHECMLMGMALDPDWIRDMCDVYSDMLIALWEIAFDEVGQPDGMYFYEDMGFKNRPFMSPQMYKEIIWPSHKKTFDFCHARGMPVIVHSCGYVEQLVPGLIEAGMDCLEALEVKAGMDLGHLKQRFGDHIALIGGLDVRTLIANDRDAIQAELDLKLPAAMAGSGYILHSDHSIPSEVDYDTYEFFRTRALEMGTY